MHISILCTESRKRRSENRKKYTEKDAELKQIPAGRILAVYDGHRFPGETDFAKKRLAQNLLLIHCRSTTESMVQHCTHGKEKKESEKTFF